jgi:aspartate racemase
MTIRTALKNLEICGAEVAGIASNTPHHRFESITQGIRILVINIVDAAAKQCLRLGACQMLILGTPITMNSLKFRKTFSDYGIQTTGPGDEQKES